MLLLEWKTQPSNNINERSIEYGFAFKWLSRICPAEVLDVGPGKSAWPHIMANCGFRVTAVDKIKGYWRGSFFNRHYYIINDDISKPKIAKKFNPTKTILLRNLPILELIDTVRPTNQKRDKPIIIYAGGLSRIRGIKEIIQTMELVGDKAELWLLGEWSSEEYKKECENLGGWKYTNYLGYIPCGEHYSFIKIANIGLINFLPLPNQERAMPNKPFEYMACSLPMVMSNFSYWQEIFSECALFVNPYDPEDIAEKVLYLLDNPDEAKKLSDEGRELIEKKYNWEAEQGKLLDVYKKVLNK